MIPVLTALVVAAVVVLVAVVAGWAYQTANRLDRLHVRYDLSWQALDGALARRAVVARAVAVDAYGDGPDGRRLAALADAAERAPRQAREAAENELSAPSASVWPWTSTRRPGCCSPGVSTTMRSGTPSHSGNAHWCARYGWAEPPRCQAISRYRRVARCPPGRSRR